MRRRDAFTLVESLFAAAVGLTVLALTFALLRQVSRGEAQLDVRAARVLAAAQLRERLLWDLARASGASLEGAADGGRRAVLHLAVDEGQGGRPEPASVRWGFDPKRGMLVRGRHALPIGGLAGVGFARVDGPLPLLEVLLRWADRAPATRVSARIPLGALGPAEPPAPRPAPAGGPGDGPV